MSSIIKTTPQTMIKAGSENKKWKAGGGRGNPDHQMFY